jgi:hypothetical protein
VTTDRVAEALAALEAAEKGATPGPWDPAWFGIDLVGDNSHCAEDSEFIARWRNAAPALLAIAQWAYGFAESDYAGDPAAHVLWMQVQFHDALAELAESVLGP